MPTVDFRDNYIRAYRKPPWQLYLLARIITGPAVGAMFFVETFGKRCFPGGCPTEFGYYSRNGTQPLWGLDVDGYGFQGRCSYLAPTLGLKTYPRWGWNGPSMVDDNNVYAGKDISAYLCTIRCAMLEPPRKRGC